MRFESEGSRIIIREGRSETWIEPWGEDAVRVRMSMTAQMDGNDWALTEPVCAPDARVCWEETDTTEPWDEGGRRLERVPFLTNGKITARVNPEGWIRFENQRGELLTAEKWSNRNRLNRYALPLNLRGREMKPALGAEAWELTARFEAFDGEKLFGMGQYQDHHLDKKGSVLELAHRNSQASVPFVVSSRGYGFLWNNPAVGTASFASNGTVWTARSTRKMDYYITAGDTPAEILGSYSLATGRAPMMPEFGLGYWQCKLRYRTQEEILAVAREHKRRGYPLDAIVVDFFHWTKQGEYKFNPLFWPDPDAMVKELKEMGVETVVSVWPTVDERSENYGYMADHGLLITTDRGGQTLTGWMGPVTYFDPTNPEARRFVWERCKENYYSKGIRLFWLDEAEPEYGDYDFDLYRYWAGPALQTANIYPVCYAKGFYEGLREAGEEGIISLVRCAWAGSQKYGALTWSGDISSTWRAFREQLQAGLSMGMAGIPWWCSDLGGFIGGYPKDPDFRELLARWFAWGCFCPVFRMHGERQPWYPVEPEYIDGVRQIASGQPNEVWSYGEETEKILSRFLFIRERIRPYVRRLMTEAHETGMPPMRPLLVDFPEDARAWETEDCYMFGPELLVAPVMESGARERTVYLPAGTDWIDDSTGERYAGGQEVTVPAPLDVIPVFRRADSDLRVYAHEE